MFFYFVKFIRRHKDIFKEAEGEFEELPNTEKEAGKVVIRCAMFFYKIFQLRISVTLDSFLLLR